MAGAFALGTALAQDTSTTTSVTAGGAGVSTSTIDGAGTITTYTPGSDYISFRTETSAEPVKYYYTSKSTVVDSDGRAVEWSMLKPDMPVHYTYTKDGDRLVITRVTLEKPISYYEKKETTTTTTTPNGPLSKTASRRAPASCILAGAMTWNIEECPLAQPPVALRQPLRYNRTSKRKRIIQSARA